MIDASMLQLLYTGGPTAIVLAIGFIALKKDMTHVKTGLDEMKETHKSCNAHHSAQVDGLHMRVTAIQERVAKVEAVQTKG